MADRVADELQIAYGPLPDQVADVWLPRGTTGGPVPLVIVVHGGFWRVEYDRGHARPQCVALATAGYAVVAIEYRRIGGGGGWPATFDDVSLALDTVPEAVASVASGRVDIRRVVHVGHSAGGHLAAWAASRHRLPASDDGRAVSRWRTSGPDPALRGVVSLAGVLDLTACAELDLDDGAARELLGGGPADVPERYAAADPLRLAPAGVPMILLHGTDDRHVPPEFSRRYAAAGLAPETSAGGAGFGASAGGAGSVSPAKASVGLVELAGVEHFALIDPQSSAWPAVLAAVADLTASDA